MGRQLPGSLPDLNRAGGFATKHRPGHGLQLAEPEHTQTRKEEGKISPARTDNFLFAVRLIDTPER